MKTFGQTRLYFKTTLRFLAVSQSTAHCTHSSSLAIRLIVYSKETAYSLHPQCGTAPVDTFQSYTTQRDARFLLWIRENGTIPRHSWFINRLHAALSKDISGHSLRAGGHTFCPCMCIPTGHPGNGSMEVGHISNPYSSASCSIGCITFLSSHPTPRTWNSPQISSSTPVAELRRRMLFRTRNTTPCR